MIEPLWQAVRPHLDVDRMRSEVAEFFQYSRQVSFDAINQLARLIADRMVQAGMEDVRLIEFPADGRTFYGGWAMPRAYDVRSARLVDSATGTVLADYEANPTNLMMYSLPTAPDGVTAELAVADSQDEMTPERVQGKLVLTHGIGVEYGLSARRAGAAGLVSDCRNGRRFYKEGSYLDSTNEWHNYTIPPWDLPDKGFGFSITPEQGRRLRERLASGEKVRLHAVVDTRHYDGVLPVISGKLPGRLPEELALTGHFDEFGADDNCSQVAVALEAVRAVAAMVKAGEIPPLERTIRVLFPMEVRGFNALIQRDDEIRHLRAGLNIDTVGTDQNAVTSSCSLSGCFVAQPSFTEELAAELLDRIGRNNPLFRWHEDPAETIDNVFSEPLVGAPTPAIYHYSGTHHLALDTPELISSSMLFDMARLTATYAAFLATAGHQEALWLAELCADGGERRLRAIASDALRSPQNPRRLRERIHAETEAAKVRVSSAGWISPHPDLCPTPDSYAQVDLPPDEERLFHRKQYERFAAGHRLTLESVEFGGRRTMLRRVRLVGQNNEHEEETPRSKSRCVPVKAFRGFLAFEDLNDDQRARLQRELGIAMGWGAPGWLQQALMLGNGKRTAGEIADILRAHGLADLESGYLERVFTFLAEREMVRLRPYLTRDDVRAALERLGIASGDTLVGHFSLSRTGYIEGGADALIDAVLELLGPEGTLMMPTFTFSWVGNPPYDRETTRSRVGAVPERFRNRNGVLRSAHPTHSFAATGPRAGKLVQGHDHTHSPLDEQSPLARLAEMDGKVLLCCPLGSNTSLHLGERRGGVPLPDFLCHWTEDGVRREGIVPQCPWHGRFDAAYERLFARGQVRETPLGEGTICSMRCRDAIQAQQEVAQETPELLLQPGCDCPACRLLREHCHALGRNPEA